jgi:tetratricopeptide (TPR) repeat protein
MSSISPISPRLAIKGEDKLFFQPILVFDRFLVKNKQWHIKTAMKPLRPLFAPAILTVGSIEYQLGREDAAMELFLTLTTLPADEPDLPVIIDKAGDFLMDEEAYDRARALYAAAENAFPDVTVYPIGFSYCLGELGLYEEAVAKARRADELEPLNYLHLNNLGWSLYQAGHLEEARATLEKSLQLAPVDNDLVRNNLKEVQEALDEKAGQKHGE